MMQLIEREGFLQALRKAYHGVADGLGCSVFISGEAGIGKTSLVRSLCEQLHCSIFQGTCDALFTPRPLGPLYDIIWQLGGGSWDITDRVALFARLFHELSTQAGPTVLIFEDIHWADEGTLDFIKFLSRRIARLPLLLILTYRDDEIHGQHPLSNVLGHLPVDSFVRMQLPPLSREAVDRLTEEKGFRREDIYSITGGNPFYVQEILATYSPGVPDNIKDSILSVYNRQEATTREVWDVLSVLPTGLETDYLQRIDTTYERAVENSFTSKILLVRDGRIIFKHELYRRTIEARLPPLTAVALNKKVLELFLDDFVRKGAYQRIIHHAKAASLSELALRYIPAAAQKAAAVGAHAEAARLYFSGIAYAERESDLLCQLYESYAYECYVTNQVREAIVYQEKALVLREKKGDQEKLGDCLRFLSRLWWFGGNCTESSTFGHRAVKVLAPERSSGIKAMAFSNLSQLNMLADEHEEAIFWGDQAISMARETDDQETLCHALNNVGVSRLRIPSTIREGRDLLRQSLDIALEHSFHEHAARAYTNLVCNNIEIKEYASAATVLEEGLAYCEKRDLDAWMTYMVSWKGRLLMETGRWEEAHDLCSRMLLDKHHSPITRMNALIIVAMIRMRRGQEDVLPLLFEAKTAAFTAMELQRIGPVLSALLEYEWLTGRVVIEQEALDVAIGLKGLEENVVTSSEFAFWLWKAREQRLQLKVVYEGFDIDNQQAAAIWEKTGSPYEQAIRLFEGGDDDKRRALSIMQDLGAVAIQERMKQDMRASGIKKIPRGARRTTLSNSALLTGRELDVLQCLKNGMQNKEIASSLFISTKTVDHHISAILFKFDVNSRVKAVQQALRQGILS